MNEENLGVKGFGAKRQKVLTNRFLKKTAIFAACLFAATALEIERQSEKQEHTMPQVRISPNSGNPLMDGYRKVISDMGLQKPLMDSDIPAHRISQGIKIETNRM